MNLDDKTILITGGTGSFGKARIAHILDEHEPRAIRVYSCGKLKESELQRQHADENRIGDLRDLPRQYHLCHRTDGFPYIYGDIRHDELG
ncbi:MAG: polysaccharide biosynthesis protein [Acidimicrobiales bacterium]